MVLCKCAVRNLTEHHQSSPSPCEHYAPAQLPAHRGQKCTPTSLFNSLSPPLASLHFNKYIKELAELRCNVTGRILLLEFIYAKQASELLGEEKHAIEERTRG